MLVDALLAADPVLRISDRIWDARQFVRLDDSLLKVVVGGVRTRGRMNFSPPNP